MYKRTVLDNGIRIVTEEIPHVRSVTLGFWVRSGSRNEDVENNGISHLIEHLLFKGTENRSARDIAEAIDAAGGQLNAFTSKEHTCYYARVLDRHLSLATEVLADMILHSTIPDAELEKERGVILEEIKMYEDSPDELVHDLFAASILQPHPLAQSVLGRAENIESMTREQIFQHIRQHYVPENLVISAAGHIQHGHVVREIERHFRNFSGRAPQQEEARVHPRVDGTIRYKDTEQVHLCLGVLGLPRRDPDRYALYVLDTVLGGGMSSRLFQELREERGLVYSTYSYHACFREAGLFTIYAGTSPEHADYVVDLVREECQSIARHGVDGEELHRAKEQIKGNLMLSLENTANRMSRVAKSELFSEQFLTADELMARIDAVNADDMARIGDRLFGSNNLAIAAVGPVPHNFPLRGVVS